MAGHSQFKNIMHRKGAQDKKRAKVFTKIIRELTTAARTGLPDPAANPYLAFSALLLAGLDGIQNRIDPGDPLDKNLYELPPEELAHVPSVPDSLSGAIKALSDDHGFLLKGDVFNEDFVANWIEMKQKEYDALRLRPHPYEFAMYYDV